MGRRINEHCIGQYLTDSSFVFDTTYLTVLRPSILPTYEANTRCVATETIPLAQNSYGSGLTKNFILQYFFDFITVLDGLVSGNVRFQLRQEAGYGTSICYGYAVIALLSITPGGSTTSLGTITTNVVETENSAAYDLTVDIPYAFTLNNKSISSTDRLLLRVTYFAKTTQPVPQGKTALAHFALNSNNVFVDLPLVLED